MTSRRAGAFLGDDRSRRVLGGVAALVVAAVVYLQFSFYLGFGRDQSIYVYGGQRFTHGVPPYASIMDPKGPVAGILSGFGVAAARVLGRDDVLAVRVEFFVLTAVSALGVYLLVLHLWDSVVAALVAVAVFASFRSYAYFAAAGPDGHTPGTVFLVFALWLAVRRRWYWSAVAASLAFCTWQPLFWVPVLVAVCAMVWSPGHRGAALVRSVAGSVTPVVALFAYYWASGYPGKLVEGLFVFPLVGVNRQPIGLGDQLSSIATNTWTNYPLTTILLVLGAAVVVAAAVRSVLTHRPRWREAFLDPVVLLLGVGVLVQLPYLVYDYIGPSHWYPMLPFAAAGFGLLAKELTGRASDPAVRRRVNVALLSAALVLTAVCAVAYYSPTPGDAPLRSEQANACAVQKALVPGTPLWVMGNPIPLVLLHRVNPDNYPYVGSGLDQWKIDHTPGGFAGWTAQIRRSRASVVVVDVWKNVVNRERMQRWLHEHGYVPGFIGRWRVFVTPAAHARMKTEALKLGHGRHLWPLSSTGERYTVTHCSAVAAG